MSKQVGPNVKELIAHKMALDAIPNGGNFADGIAYLMDAERMRASAKAAQDFVEQAIAVVKTAPDNPYGDDDEVIAGELCQRIKEREAEKRKAHRDHA